MPRTSLRNLNITQLSEVSGLAQGTISAALNKAGLKPVSTGKQKLFDAPQALRVLLTGSDLDPRAERARLDSAKADLAELELQRKRGDLLDASTVEAIGAAVTAGLQMRIMGLRNLGPEVRIAASDAEASEIIENAARDALAELARLDGVVDDARRAGQARVEVVAGDADATAEADGGGVGGRGASALDGERSGAGSVEDEPS